MKTQAWCAFRVAVYDRDTGETFTRDYVRGEKRMGVDAFAAWALGDFLLTTGVSNNVRWRMEPVEWRTVRENRLYHHTTH